ncbi:uncharacterized protein LOC126896164 [Daktulosphaira vitifoliae]|uniref:uncharacterized protein LOC126896164 n=1 Tax=Daktulosphaira vitifoliae TaxID=58002 RepID=UPI0021AA06EC|nr:uncharacterized protein LOC126896164 [Daktulosphaira vitifoliae]
MLYSKIMFQIFHKIFVVFLFCFTIVHSMQTNKVNSSNAEEILSPENTCLICLTRPKTVTLKPCGHMFCNTCINYYVGHYNYSRCSVCCREFTSIIGIIPEDLPKLDDQSQSLTGGNDEIDRSIVDRYHRMEPLTSESFEIFSESLTRKDFSIFDLIARYLYLRRNENPDDKLIKDVENGFLEQNSTNISCDWHDLYFSLVNCDDEQEEFLVYIGWFRPKLNQYEKDMLKSYYIRQGLNPDEEFFKRAEYVYNTM